MKRIWQILILVVLLGNANSFSQCTGTQLNWQNPSFEGTPGTPHVTPPLWDICQPGTTPDTQPGCWGVTLPPSNGNSYIGLVDQASTGWHEGASQLLSSPMIAGTTYNFTIDLAWTNTTGGGIIPGCCELQIYGNMGGNSGCDMTALCWSSGNVTSLTWVTYTVSFTPTQNWTHLLFMIHNLGCTDQPYILMDNLTPIMPIADVPQFTWTNVCVGNSMQFTDQSTSNQGTITTWHWDFGDGSPPSSTHNPSHLYSAPGTYNTTLTITSTVPCTTTVTHPVIVYPLPTVSVTPGNTSICSGSSITCTANGASTYQWAPASGLSATSGTTVTANPASTTTYTVTGTNTNGCTNTTSFTISVNPNPVPSITYTDATCGASNGTATVSPAGLTYLWSNAQNTQTITGLPPGSYTVTVTDANGCTGLASCTIANIPAGNVTVTSTDEHCGHADGTATATIVGGTPPYYYLWSTSQTTSTITGLPSGVYSVTTSDGNSCTATGTVTITNLAGPSLQVVTTVNETCTYGNGSATVNGINGTPGYTYLWSNGATTETALNLSAGTYGVTVNDANNCTALNTVTITDSPPPTLLTSTTPADCGQADGTATVNVTGGLQPYTYLWSTIPQQSTQTAINILAGTYSVTVTDSNSCTATAFATINITNVITATITSTVEYCDRSDGTATALPVGGSGVYTYLWNNGQTTQTATGLAAGSYSVTVSDGYCSANASVNIVEIPGPEAGFTAHPHILTLLDGPVSFTDHSTGNNVSWYWDYGDGSSSGFGTDPDHQYMNLGTYWVTEIVTDVNGCSDTINDSITIKEMYTIYIPNAFTPNSDLTNDVFLPRGVNIDPDNYEMYIFDRWGKLLFKTTELEKGWNGTFHNNDDVSKVVMGVYVYRISLKELDGPRHEYIGRVTLVP